MLQIKNIKKKYVTGDLTQVALDDVSFNLRDSEFVAILGQSGSGKTTLLNIIGGLDRYDSGDIIINGISTKKYKDRDWDSYRNHSIGFVFQSYNLIPHQSIQANVELALTISGTSKGERKKMARQALDEVGLKGQYHKRPNQLSGGQMQRVAIARALVNNPDIVLADEPTGALDSETSVQVMNLLKEVAKNRLVVMVTHNGELAEEYATRTIRLGDGKFKSDTNPYEVDVEKLDAPEHKNMGKSSMSFLTSLALSFNNLRTKKARTFLTAFAGSIGIIGIAMILSLSSGVNAYINSIQKDTMTSYPISIDAQSFDIASMMVAGQQASNQELDHSLDGVYTNPTGLTMTSKASSNLKENNLTPFKAYLDDENSEIHQYLGENGIVYSYDVAYTAYAYDSEDTLVNTDGSDFETGNSGMGMMSSMGLGASMGVSMSGSSLSTGHFQQLMPGTGENLISTAVTESYEVLYGNWPATYNEVVFVLDKNNEITTSALYDLGILPASEYEEILDKIKAGEEMTFESQKLNYEEICNQTFYMIPASDYYVENEKGLFEDVSADQEAVKKLLDSSIELKVVGVIRPLEDATYEGITKNVGYTSALTDYLIEYSNNSSVVKAQEATPDVNVINGMTFEPKDDSAKVADTIEYLTNMNISEKASLMKNMMGAMAEADPSSAEMLSAMDETQLAGMLDEYLLAPEDEALLSIYDANISTSSYDDNMAAFGVVSLDAPLSISLYADSFEGKDGISASIDHYNEGLDAKDQITFTDYVGLLMSSITTIVDVISYVLIAFVGVSLVVSSIMIGIITYISVLERTKEIGILRAMGASKGNISQVFNAETFIVGLISGLLGVGITVLLNIPISAIIHALTGSTDVNAVLPLASALVLVVLSMGLTLFAGLIPSRQAAKKDPVIALRSE